MSASSSTQTIVVVGVDVVGVVMTAPRKRRASTRSARRGPLRDSE
jgi:hypothetical protein